MISGFRLQVPSLQETRRQNSKFQTPQKLQTSNSNPKGPQHFEIWVLEFLWSLDVGAWSFLTGGRGGKDLFYRNSIVQRAAHAQARLLHDMRVNLRRRHILVAE